METEIETGQLLTEVRIIFSGLLAERTFYFQIKKNSEETTSCSSTPEELKAIPKSKRKRHSSKIQTKKKTNIFFLFFRIF